jgi:hypothetical protein
MRAAGGGILWGERSVAMMADVKTDETGATAADETPSASNARIMAWIEAELAEAPTEEELEWARRFRAFVAEKRLTLSRREDR